MVVDWRQGSQRQGIDPVPVQGLQGWLRGGRNLASNRQVGVMLLGDSITQGGKASNWYRTSWRGLVRDALAARYGLAGEYVQACDDSFMTGGAMDAASRQAVWNPTTGEGTACMTGFSIQRTMALNDTLTFTPVSAFTDFDLILTQQNGWCPFSLTVDAVAQTAANLDWVDNTGALQLQAAPVLSGNSTAAGGDANPHRWARYRTWSGGPFAATTHTIVITATGGAGVLNVGGIIVYPKGRTAPGIVMTCHACFGKKAAELGVSGWIGSFPQYDLTKATVSDWQPAPSLVVIGLGINDIVNGGGTNSLAFALDMLARRALAVGAGIVFMGPYWATVAAYRSTVLATISGIALAYGAPFIDASVVFGGDAAALTYVTSAGDSHPNDLGHALLAQAVLSVIDPQVV